MVDRFRAITTKGAFAGALLGIACSDILGIETAHVDASLNARGGASGGVLNRSQGGGISAAGQTGGSAADLCTGYCDATMRHCQGEFQQYVNLNQCLRICSMFPVGSITELDQNTVSCRLKYAQKAEYESGKELAGDCPAAGPGGGGLCGSRCDAFCTILMKTCQKGLTDPYFYASHEECVADCSTLPVVPYSTAVATLTTGDNTLECRLFHVTSAAMLDPEEHCGHAMGITLCEAPSAASAR